MLIAIMPEEIRKLNNFTLYTQDPTTLLCCGITNDAPINANYLPIRDILSGQEQRCLPPTFGKYLSLSRIEEALSQRKNDDDILTAVETAYQEGVNSI